MAGGEPRRGGGRVPRASCCPAPRNGTGSADDRRARTGCAELRPVGADGAERVAAGELCGLGLAALVAGTVIAVDPAGFVPTGPLRWTVIALTTGVAVVALLCSPVAIPRRFSAVWAAFLGVLSIATIRAADPLHAWIGMPDRRLRPLAWITFPLLFLAGCSCATRAATRLVLRAGTLGALVLGVWSGAELLGFHPLLTRTTLADRVEG